jgi:hypothetical protein
LQHGFEPCATAQAAVERNHGTLAWCAVEDGGIVRLGVTRTSTGLPGPLARQATATARAGPRT